LSLGGINLTSKEDDDSQVDEEENEPIECECKYCETTGLLEHMVHCQKFDEEIKRGMYDPGWIHKECCETEFKDNPSDCLEYCDEQHYLIYLKDIIDELVDLTDLKKTNFKGVESYFSKDHTYMLSFEMNKLVESFRPLNVVVDMFEDINNDIFYVKDNLKYIQQYSLANYNDIFDRLEKIKKSYLSYDLYCVKDGRARAQTSTLDKRENRRGRATQGSSAGVRRHTRARMGRPQSSIAMSPLPKLLYR
jgi:hypothetical protein